MADNTDRTRPENAPQENEPQEKDNPVWSLVLWGGGALVAVGYGIWCIFDGWISETVSESTKTFSQWTTPVSFAVALWCLWRGRREYRDAKAKAQGQGGRAATPPKAADGPGDFR